jgi:sugar phosphate isomerase/epimerase
MIFGNAAWGFRETPLEKQLRITKKMGLENLELSIGGHHNDYVRLDAGDEIIQEAKELFNRYGIKLLCGSASNDFTHESESECLQELKRVEKAIDIAGKLGIAHVRIFAGFSPATDVAGKRWDRMISCLSEASEHASSLGVSVAVETHGGVESGPGGVRHFHSTSSKPELLLKMMSGLPPEAKIVFDPANLGAVGMDEDEIISLYRKLKSKIAYMHLKDFKRSPSGGGLLIPCACGEGRLGWEKLMSAFSGFSGIGMIEYENTKDVQDGLNRSLAVLKRWSRKPKE